MTMKWQDTPFKNPLARARGLGSTHHGAMHWLHQRATGVANLGLMGWLVWTATQMPAWTYDTFTAWLAQPINAVLMVLVIVTTFYHAALGLQVVIEDYVSSPGKRIVTLAALRFVFVAATIASVFSILKIAFA